MDRVCQATGGLLLISALLGPAVHPAGAQRGPREVEDLLPDSELDDPIGVSRQEGALSETVAQERAQQRKSAAAEEMDRLRYGPHPPLFRPRQGEALTAMGPVRELDHQLSVHFEEGLARVRVQMRFDSRSVHPAELSYRLAIPDDAAAASLRVCNDVGCRDGLARAGTPGFSAYDDAVQARAPDSSGLPVAELERRDDERGAALRLRAAPVAKGSELHVTIEYVAALPMRGGVARLSLPARGMDPRAAPASVQLSAPGMLDPRLGEYPAQAATTQVEPWSAIDLSARLKSHSRPGATLLRYPCGDGTCGHAHVWAGPVPLHPLDLILALDVSPSMEGPARGRALAALAALLNVAPEGSRVRAFMFAGKTQALVSSAMPAAAVSLRGFAPVEQEQELGSATRLEPAVAQALDWLKEDRRYRLKPLLVVVGDGGMTVDQGLAFQRARRARLPIAALNLSDRATLPALQQGARRSGGLVLELGAAADAERRSPGRGLLEEHLAALFSPTVARRVTLHHGAQTLELGPLRAGQQRSWDGPLGAAARLAAGRTFRSRTPPRGLLAAMTWRGAALRGQDLALFAVDPRDLETGSNDRPPRPASSNKRKPRCDPRGPASRLSGLSTDERPVALAERRACIPATSGAPNAVTMGRGMPAEPLLDMLRRRVLPVARGCFRRDRAGRLDYEVRAVFAFELANREVVSAHIEGTVDAELRRCLLSAVDTLEVPRFSGTVIVRYPLRTQAEPLPREIELTPSTAAGLDSLLEAR